MKIEFRVSGEVEINALASSVLAALADVEASVTAHPGLRSALHVGTHLYHLEFRERELLGVYYTPECIVRYSLQRPAHVSWSTLDGNLRSDGDFHVRSTARGCAVRYAVSEVVDLPLVPPLIAGAQLLGRVELDRQLRSLLAALDVESHPLAGFPAPTLRGRHV
ncbi:SRPBCC family protein [Derxia lacustris]|uniref:hypothetical protein n=1 Tax=Derxia lacustris TaxID=764842 RepID=UPI000A1757FE|nr:hypothetical protein [Derxia lacustris]